MRSQYGEARVPGRPSTRPEQECVAVRDFVRPLRRAASHSSRSRLLHMNFAVLLARLGAARLPWAAAISRRPSTAATWPDLLADLCLPTFISNHHQLQSQSTRPGKIPIVFSTWIQSPRYAKKSTTSKALQTLKVIYWSNILSLAQLNETSRVKILSIDRRYYLLTFLKKTQLMSFSPLFNALIKDNSSIIGKKLDRLIDNMITTQINRNACRASGA